MDDAGLYDGGPPLRQLPLILFIYFEHLGITLRLRTRFDVSDRLYGRI